VKQQAACCLAYLLTGKRWLPVISTAIDTAHFALSECVAGKHCVTKFQVLFAKNSAGDTPLFGLAVRLGLVFCFSPSPLGLPALSMKVGSRSGAEKICSLSAPGSV